MDTDLTGRRFGHLVVVEQARQRGQRSYWLCQCDCGVTRVVVAVCLLDGKAASCGCRPVVSIAGPQTLAAILAVTQMRVCTSCQTLLPLVRFDRAGNQRDGHRAQCRNCCAQAKRAWRAARAQQRSAPAISG